MPVACRQPLKKALLVGIMYSTNENLISQDFLAQPGAHKDTERMQRLLTTKYGYKSEDITILVDSDHERDTTHWPTRENILDAMKNLVAGTQRGDRIVFSFSGHGGQVEAREDQNEADGQDEVLLAIDSEYDPCGYPDQFSNFIRDDEIRRILVKGVPDGVRCTMVFDCCHSGTASDLPSVMSPITPNSPLMSGVSSFMSHSEGEELIPVLAVRLQTVHDETLSQSCQYQWPSSCPANRGTQGRRTSTSWSACLDNQLTFGKRSGGIFIEAFTTALSSQPHPTHWHLLQSLR
ncbi:peptidase C14, caspase domain-containing protein [Daedaleopsis nitida]|nr:peptidase C14, caspase domain-containing protein [Daedaleopsis nitida]